MFKVKLMFTLTLPYVTSTKNSKWAIHLNWDFMSCTCKWWMLFFRLLKRPDDTRGTWHFCFSLITSICVYMKAVFAHVIPSKPDLFVCYTLTNHCILGGGHQCSITTHTVARQPNLRFTSVSIISIVNTADIKSIEPQKTNQIFVLFLWRKKM